MGTFLESFLSGKLPQVELPPVDLSEEEPLPVPVKPAPPPVGIDKSEEVTELERKFADLGFNVVEEFVKTYRECVEEGTRVSLLKMAMDKVFPNAKPKQIDAQKNQTITNFVMNLGGKPLSPTAMRKQKAKKNMIDAEPGDGEE